MPKLHDLQTYLLRSSRLDVVCLVTYERHHRYANPGRHVMTRVLGDFGNFEVVSGTINWSMDVSN